MNSSHSESNHNNPGVWDPFSYDAPTFSESMTDNIGAEGQWNFNQGEGTHAVLTEDEANLDQARNQGDGAFVQHLGEEIPDPFAWPEENHQLEHSPLIIESANGNSVGPRRSTRTPYIPNVLMIISLKGNTNME